MLGWHHSYHALLEELSALQGGHQSFAAAARSAGAQSAGAQSVPQQRRLEQIASLERQLGDIEARRHITERWSADSEEYRAAGRERKVIEIQRCESSLQSLFVRHHALRREFRNTPFRERQSSVHVRKSMASLLTKAKHVIEELQAWHAAPGPNQLHYDPAALDASSLLSGDVLPWQRESVSANLLTVKAAELKQLNEHRQRCSEEVQIVEREAGDMLAFYEHYERQLTLQVSILQTAVVHTDRVPGEYHAVTAVAAYQAGATAILLGKLQHIRAMQDAASALVVKLQQQQLEMPGSNSIDEALGAEDDGAGNEAEDYADDGEVFFDAGSMDIDENAEQSFMEDYDSMSS